jgi:PBP1b-binding outer membrane lipoprotein LpoB
MCQRRYLMEEAMFRKSLKVIVLAFMLLLSACAQTTASNPNQPAPSNPSDPSNPNNPSTPGVPNTPRTANG